MGVSFHFGWRLSQGRLLAGVPAGVSKGHDLMRPGSYAPVYLRSG